MSYLDSVRSIKKVAIYLRVSTDMQVEKFSLPAQVTLTHELIEKHGWQIYKVYRDEGFSGTLIEKRPAFYAMLQDAAARLFDAVVVTDSDRLARPENLRDMGIVQQVFIENDVKLVSLSEIIDLRNNDQWFASSLLGLVASLERKKIIARIKRGIQAKKQSGLFHGSIPPSGYEWDDKGMLRLRQTTERFQRAQRQYICYDAHFVRDVVDMYLYKDVSVRAISIQKKISFQTLAEMFDRAWFYAGFVLVTRSKGQWAAKKKLPREPLSQGKHPPIITPAEAERILEKRKSLYVSYRKTRDRFPTAGLVSCGICGDSMYLRAVNTPRSVRRYYHYYVCKTRHGTQRYLMKQKGNLPPPCPMPFVRVDHVEKAVWSGLEYFLSSPQTVVKEVGDVGHQTALLERQQEEIERGLADVARRRSNLIDLYEHGGFKLTELDPKMDALKSAEASLDRKRRECVKAIESYRTDGLQHDRVLALLSRIAWLVRVAKPEHHREIVRTLCRKIIARPDGMLEISAALPQERDISGFLVGMEPLEPPSPATTPDGELCQFAPHDSSGAEQINITPLIFQFSVQLGA